MHNNPYNKPPNQEQPVRHLHEGLQYRDLDGLMKPTVHVDEFSSKMGDDADIIVLSFFVRDKAAAKDLVSWFEKGYDFVLDADRSPGHWIVAKSLVVSVGSDFQIFIIRTIFSAKVSGVSGEVRLYSS